MAVVGGTRNIPLHPLLPYDFAPPLHIRKSKQHRPESREGTLYTTLARYAFPLPPGAIAAPLSSKFGQQLRMDSGKFVFRGLRLRPPDDEALLVRVGRLGDNVEVDVIHELSGGRMRAAARAQKKKKTSRNDTMVIIIIIMS